MRRIGILAGILGLLMAAGCGDFVSTVNSRCRPLGCGELEKECGTWSDGCGGKVDCGGCPGGETCRADGLCVSQCEPSTCEEMDLACGVFNDGCGGTIDCGTCPPDQSCNAQGQCVDARLVQQDRVSDCGGFEAAGGQLFDRPADYCLAEKLHWLYDPDNQELKLADTRVLLNCCGDHGMTVEEADGLYLVTETDAPEDGWGRCGCMCVFDYTVVVEGIPQGVIRLKIVREVTDWPEGSGEVWEGDIDLATGSGVVVIDETDVGPWCDTY